MITLTGPQARALGVAWSAFAAECGDADLSRYEVELTALAASIEIAFVPGPDEPSVRGGRTAAGPEIHYHVAPADGTIVRRDLAR